MVICWLLISVYNQIDCKDGDKKSSNAVKVYIFGKQLGKSVTNIQEHHRLSSYLPLWQLLACPATHPGVRGIWTGVSGY